MVEFDCFVVLRADLFRDAGSGVLCSPSIDSPARPRIQILQIIAGVDKRFIHGRSASDQSKNLV